MTEYTGVLLRISEVSQNSKFTPLSETTRIPAPFICETPLPLPLRLALLILTFREVLPAVQKLTDC